MKTKPAMDPAAAFPDAKRQPSAAELKAALGRAADPIEQVLGNLRATQPAVATEWHFSDRSGWHQIHLLKKRRLFYFVPKCGDFSVRLILGGKALALLKQGTFARRIVELLVTAKHYPEGKAFSFDYRTLDPDLMAALLAAKIAH